MMRDPYLNVNETHEVPKLTKREQECLQHLMSGKSAKISGDEMGISSRTVEFHINNIKAKIGCRTKLEVLNILNHFMKKQTEIETLA
jgi:DNA-binding CsgD family transcriptional regulator